MVIQIEYLNPITNNHDEIDVDIFGEFETESSGIGSYEYWGFRGYDKEVTYLICANIKWDTDKYDEPTNGIIKDYIDKNFSHLSDKLVAEQEED
ncbi:MAG: hypothetical protein EB127_26715 [Alphaproteobacteria bacterium]|nr:hypothetical protein [Alphaproteobacteria bacterium]